MLSYSSKKDCSELLLFSPLLLSFPAVVFTFFHWLERTKANFFGLTWMFIQSSERAICGTEANFAKTSGYFCCSLLFAKYQQLLWNIQQEKSYPALFDRILVRWCTFVRFVFIFRCILLHEFCPALHTILEDGLKVPCYDSVLFFSYLKKEVEFSH